MGARPGMTAEEKQQAAVMSAQGATPNSIGKALRRDGKTVSKALREPEVVSLIEEVKGELADAFESLTRRMLGSITDADIQKISSYQRVVASGICTDKMRLIRGQSTNNTAMFFRIVAEAPDLPDEGGE